MKLKRMLSVMSCVILLGLLGITVNAGGDGSESGSEGGYSSDSSNSVSAGGDAIRCCKPDCKSLLEPRAAIGDVSPALLSEEAMNKLADDLRDEQLGYFEEHDFDERHNRGDDCWYWVNDVLSYELHTGKIDLSNRWFEDHFEDKGFDRSRVVVLLPTADAFAKGGVSYNWERLSKIILESSNWSLNRGLKGPPDACWSVHQDFDARIKSLREYFEYLSR